MLHLPRSFRFLYIKFFFIFCLSPIFVFSQTLSYKGLERTYRLHIPQNYHAGKAVPLVVILHGGGGNAERMGRFTGFDHFSDRDTFIAVYPQAWKKHWNDGRDLDKYDAQKDRVDDVGFISALIDTLQKKYTIADKKIYVTGLSNGGMMTFRLGCELGARFAAIAPVIASMPRNLMEQRKPPDPVSVLIINGTDDPLMPYGGGQVKLGKQELGEVVSTEESFRFWCKNNACTTDSVYSQIPDSDTGDGCATTRVVFSCPGQTEVVLYTIHGGGHNMPGCMQYLPRSIIGNTSHDFSGADVIWGFFKQH